MRHACMLPPHAGPAPPTGACRRRLRPYECPPARPPPAPRQITTCRGIVMGRLRSMQRQREVDLMRFCFNKLGALRGGRGPGD